MDNLIYPELRVIVTTETATAGTISVPRMGWSQNFTVTPGVSTLIIVPNNYGQMTTDDIVTDQGIHLVTQECVSVFTQNYGSYSSDATVIFPVNSIGYDYRVLTYEDNGFFDGQSEMLIAGTEAGTIVTITLSVNHFAHAAGVPYTIALDSGQVYQLKADGDLSGTLVQSNKPVAVFGGNYCVEIGGCQYCDHLYEQMYPLTSLGREYITVPYLTRASDLIRVLASFNGTQVSINGGAPLTLNAGQYYDFSSSTVTYITSNNEVSVGQFSKGDNCDPGESGDPFYIIISPTSQSINEVTFNTLPSSVFGFGWYLNLVVKTSDIPTVRFDGAPIPAGNFTPVAQNPAFSTTRMTLANGDHTITSNLGVVGYVYGYADDESFGYAAGVRVQIPFLSVYDTTRMICPNDIVQLDLNNPDTARIIYIEWDFGDGSPHVYNTFHTTHSYPNFGDYPITIIYEMQSACVKDTITVDTVKVRGPNVQINGQTNFCFPQNNITLTATSQFATSGLLWSTGSTSNSITFNAVQDTMFTVTAQGTTCFGYDTAYIYVGHDTAGFTYTNACAGNPTIFTNTSRTVASNTYIWHWDFGDGTTSALPSPSHTYAAAGSFSVTLRLQSSAGCADSIVKTVTVIGIPDASFTVSDLCNASQLAPVNTST
ncbi:MAG TPA: PKD domain-containing protein, partial [Chitinophagales bacterium]|nr:PKD domain-containing protein [Chitinophagales bacterium]